VRIAESAARDFHCEWRAPSATERQVESQRPQQGRSSGMQALKTVAVAHGRFRLRTSKVSAAADAGNCADERCELIVELLRNFGNAGILELTDSNDANRATNGVSRSRRMTARRQREGVRR